MLSNRGDLRERKQRWVRRMIVDAAIELFAKNGFDDTTVNDVAEAAGVSRRSLFRYFANKDDLLGQEIVTYGIVLSDAIASCPKEYSPMQVLQEAAIRLAALAEAEPHTRAILDITERSAAARQAQSSRLPEAQEQVAEAYAKRLRTSAEADVNSRLLAALTFSIVEAAVRSWYRGTYKDLQSATKHALVTLGRLASDQALVIPATPPVSVVSRPARSAGRRRTSSDKPRG